MNERAGAATRRPDGTPLCLAIADADCIKVTRLPGVGADPTGEHDDDTLPMQALGALLDGKGAAAATAFAEGIRWSFPQMPEKDVAQCARHATEPGTRRVGDPGAIIEEGAPIHRFKVNH